MTAPVAYAWPLTVEAVKAYLKLDPNITSDDAYVSDLAATAMARIQRSDLAGPVDSVEYVEDVSGDCTDTIMLRHTPVLSVTSVQEWCGTIDYAPAQVDLGDDADGFRLIADVGQLLRVFPGGFSRPWAEGRRNIRVTYTAGRDVENLPPEIANATLELIAHQWRFRRGGTQTFATPDSPAPQGSSWGVPLRVSQLLGTELRAPVLG